MACGPPIPNPLDCATSVVGNAAGSVVTATGDRLAEMMRDGARWVIENTVGWWINVPSIDLAKTPVQEIQNVVLWVAIFVAVAGAMWQGIRMVLSRKPNGLVDVARGLVTVTAWSAVGITGVSMALRAADGFAAWVLDQGAQGEVADRLSSLASLTGVTSSGAVLVLGLVMIVVGLLQAVLMFLREGAIIVLTGLIVLAAAGNFTAATRPWLQRLVAWILALVVYKPMAAIIYYAALKTVGEGQDARTVFIGITMMVLSIFALPALLKFFSWAVPASTSGGGGLGALAGAASAGMYATALAGGAGRHGSVEQAHYLRSDLGPQRGSSWRGNGGGATSAPLMPGPVGPAGAGPASATATSSSAGAAGPSGSAGGAGAAGAPGKTAAAARGSAGVALAAAGAVTQAGSKALEKAKDAMGEPPV